MYGRSSAGSTKGIHVRLPKKVLDEIEGFRRGEADIPSRPGAVRRLVEEALSARQEEVPSNPHQQGA